jgi:MFS family permease
MATIMSDVTIPDVPLIQANLFNLDWRLIFLVNVPIGIGTLIAALFIVQESKSEKPIRLDIGGAVIMSIILFLLLYPLIEGRNAGWPLWMYAAIIISIILIVPFIQLPWSRIIQ